MLSDYQTLVERLVRADADDIASLDVLDAINLAVTRYSKDRPRAVVEDISAPGGQLLNLPAAWVAGFSDIQSLEYPIGEVPPNGIEAWDIYQGPDAEMIMIGDTLDAGEAVRVGYTVFHSLDTTTDTIPQIHREAVASYAAAYVCDQLAGQYAGDGNPTIQADTVDHGSKSGKFARRADKLRKRYRDQVGAVEKTSAAAGVMVDLDNNDSRGRDRFHHSRRYR